MQAPCQSAPPCPCPSCPGPGAPARPKPLGHHPLPPLSINGLSENFSRKTFSFLATPPIYKPVKFYFIDMAGEYGHNGNMDLGYVLDLARKNYKALGFIPGPKMEKYAEKGQILIEEENGEPCGYLVYGWGYPVLKVYQACIDYDVRRMAHGLALVKRLIEIGERRHCSAISLWCADDLEANGFWRSAGFQYAGQREGGMKRGRKHNRWILPLSNLLF